MTALILLAFSVLILVVGTIYVVVRPRINQWGASDQEHLSTSTTPRSSSIAGGTLRPTFCRGAQMRSRLEASVANGWTLKAWSGI
jgi:hypothetical protein